MSMTTTKEDTFMGWACPGKDQPLTRMELPLKQWDDNTVEMKVTHCGVCGSDLHVMDEGWGPTDYPCVVGHEIVGIITKVGKNVTHLRVGDRAGVGAQCDSCHECNDCLSGNENVCKDGLMGRGGTYNGYWKTGDKTYGGYADKWRGDYRFVFKIPCGLTNEMAASFFCAGVTTYAPLKTHRVQPGSRVGVIGIGGLGHFAIQWVKAMGAEAVALSHSDKKRNDAMELGADQYIVTTDKAELRKNANSLTHLLCTCFVSEGFDWSLYLDLLKNNGQFMMVAIPEKPLAKIPPLLLAGKQISVSGSIIGSPRMVEEMLQFAANTRVKPWINKYPMKDAPAAIQAMRDGKPRYRIILEQENEHA